MINIGFTMSAWMFICALIGTFIGIYFFFARESALYLKMIASGVGCAMFARLFDLVYIATQGSPAAGFNVGLLGIAGSFLFLLSANYGQMDALVDDGSRTFLKTRLTALISPAVLAAACIIFCCRAEGLAVKLPVVALTVFIAPCSYYNLKHIIIYDVENGIIEQVRPYNVLALLYGYLVMAEQITKYLPDRTFYIISCAGVGLVSLIILPVLKRGADRWTH